MRRLTTVLDIVRSLDKQTGYEVTDVIIDNHVVLGGSFYPLVIEIDWRHQEIIVVPQVGGYGDHPDSVVVHKQES